VVAGVTGHSGTVLFDNHEVNHIPPFKRGVGYLFQELALSPIIQ
jgi:ABC-type sugar transport system ATPase subunit